MRKSEYNISGIYRILNKITGKSYVGSAVNLRLRFNGHRKLLNKNKHHSKRLQNSWNKHGSNNFEFIVLELVPEVNNLIAREQYWMNYFNVVDEGYNIMPTAGSQLGMKHSPETLIKMSMVRKGKTMPAETRALIGAAHKGRKFSDEHRRKLSNKIVSEETRLKISKSRIGRRATDETKRNMSLGRMGIRPNEETRKKMSVWQIGKKHSQETLRKISEGNKGKKESEETKNKKRIKSTGRKFPARMFRSNIKDICKIFLPDRRYKINGGGQWR